jgi:hypothetical protein
VSSDGVHTGPGFWVLWAVAFAKLAVTPVMLMTQIAAVFTALKCVLCCCGAVTSAAAAGADESNKSAQEWNRRALEGNWNRR